LVDDNNGIKSYQEFDQLNTLESNNGHQHSSTTDANVGGDFVNQETESLAIENGKQLELEPEFLRQVFYEKSICSDKLFPFPHARQMNEFSPGCSLKCS
jgi:hypothetical protein